jgi:succinyl-CoA synthetase alpha subunit
MAGIILNENTKVLVQGITGGEGSKATKQMLEYGTNVICGVTPGKGGQNVEGVPVYNSVQEAKQSHPETNLALLYVPPRFAKGAVIDAIEQNIEIVVCITESIPILDTIEMLEHAKEKGTRIIGPSSVGIINPKLKMKVGSIGGAENKQYSKGPVGIISKSGGMCSETALLLKNEGIGVSEVIGIGGDAISGTDYCDLLEKFQEDKDTKVVVIYGEIGGEYEQKVAEMVKSKRFTKPLVAFVSGAFAENLPNVSLGHAGAIIEGESGTRTAKIKALKKAGVKVANIHHEIVGIVSEILDEEEN